MITKLTEVAHRTYQLQVDVPDPFIRFAVYLLAEGEGAVIDPGPSVINRPVVAAMSQLGLRNPAYIIPTHLHMDHAGGAGLLASQFPSAKVCFHPAAIRHAQDPTRVILGTKRVWGERFADYFGAIHPVPPRQTVAVADGETLGLGERELRILYAPGHNDDHIAIFDRATRALFCGEALGAPTPAAPSIPVPSVSPPSFDIDVYLGTIAKLAALDPALLCYAHAHVGYQPQALMAKVVEMTRLFETLVGAAMARGDTADVIADILRDHMREHYGVVEEGIDIGLPARGYMHYLAKKAAQASS